MNALYYIYLTIFLIGLCNYSAAQGELPQQSSSADFEAILRNKPFAKFTSSNKVKKVEVKTPPSRINWVLKGITKMSDGWHVVVANKKTPTKNLILKENSENQQAVKIVKVEPDRLDYKNTVVTIQVNDAGTQSIKFAKITPVVQSSKKPPVTTSQQNSKVPDNKVISSSPGKRKPVVRRIISKKSKD